MRYIVKIRIMTLWFAKKERPISMRRDFIATSFSGVLVAWMNTTLLTDMLNPFADTAIHQIKPYIMTHIYLGFLSL